MRSTFVMVCVLAVAVSGSSYPSEARLELSSLNDAVSICAILGEGGVMIRNTGDVNCVVFAVSPESEHEFEPAAGESVTVTGITGAVGR